MYFLYINEMPLRQDAKVYLESIEQSKKYWGDRYHLFSVSKWQKVKMTLIKYYRKKICNGFYQVDDQYPYGLESVSYTHLDVYKRQSLHRIIIRYLRSNGKIRGKKV